MEGTENTSKTQADVRVHRANTYRRIGRLCFQNGDQPGLPAPQQVGFNVGTVWLSFDTYEEAAAWAGRYNLWASTDHVYEPEWHDGPIRAITASGALEELRITVSGWSPAVVEERDGSAPEDTGPDDLSGVES